MIKWFRKLLLFLLLILNLLLVNLLPVTFVQADELEEISKQIAELEKARQMSIEATRPLEAELERLKEKLEAIKQNLKIAAENIATLEKSIEKREKDFVKSYLLLSQRVESYYKKMRQPNPFLLVLTSKTVSSLIQDFTYQEAVIGEDKKIIAQITQNLIDLEIDKKKIEKDKEILAGLQEKTNEQAKFFEGEIAGAKAYQETLEAQIAQLSARQQELLAQKLASLNLPTTLGAGPLICTDDRKIDPGFSPAFAFFTFGIPHRVGMNQYGAYGRARIGQSYQEILNVYYQGISFEKRDPNTRIKVQGFGEMGLEEYLLGVYEMPESFPMEALKAQAVAARSYALAYTDNGAKEICTTQACQVYKGGNKGGNWEQAVRATAGEVMVTGGQVISAWYASTAGGYTFFSSDVGWRATPWTKRMRDTNGEVSEFSELLDKAYDKDSPCFYAAQGWRSEYGKSAWLKSEEVADIVNVLMLAKSDSSTQKHLPQTDKPNPDGEETWDQGKVKSELRARGITPYNRIDEVSVDWDRSLGRTTNVKVSGDAGERSFDGPEFKDFFNLRSPANIQIVGPLFKVEKR